MVFARSVLHERLSALVVQVTKGIRLFQYLPALAADESTTPETLRRVEYLERMLLGGRLDGARELVDELSSTAGSDPFVGCLCGYVLLRLGQRPESCARHASLQEQRVPRFVGVEQPHRELAVPVAQSRNLLLAFHVRHRELENRIRAAGQSHRGDPRARAFRVDERRSDLEGQATSQIGQRGRQSLEPRRAIGTPTTGRRESGWNVHVRVCAP